MKRNKPKFEVHSLGRLHNIGQRKDTLHRSTDLVQKQLAVSYHSVTMN